MKQTTQNGAKNRRRAAAGIAGIVGAGACGFGNRRMEAHIRLF